MILARTLARSLLKFKTLPTTSTKFFASNVRDTLKAKLDEEIQYESQNKPVVNEYTNYFNNNGWDINYKGTQVQLSKKNGQYNVKVLFNARSPSVSEDNEQEKQQGQQEEEQENYDDYSEISVYVNKNGVNKWMCADFFVTEQSSEIAAVRFIQSYQKQVLDRFRERNTGSQYLGPQIQTLQESLNDKLGEFVQSLGVDHVLLQNASSFSIAHQHKFYLQWLKDFKSIL